MKQLLKDYRLFALFALLFFTPDLFAQVACGGTTSFQILHFTRTEGFNHGTKSESRTMFEEIGAAQNFTVVNSDSESAFDDLATLMNYEVIVFANTSGNISFSATQKMNLESYVAGGGGVLGIHAATDMYRNASYPFYTQLMGGSRRNSPAHTSNNFMGTMDKVGTHPSTANLPDPWMKEEEYYYWPDTGLVANIVPVLEVRSTGSNSYDAIRPASWYQEFPSGARSFYTTLGHKRENYTDANNEFRQHLSDALCWLVEAAPMSLPVTVLNTELETVEGLHRISWEIGSDATGKVELHGGYARETATLLKSVQSTGDLFGSVEHRPVRQNEWFYYRLRFFDADGLPNWSAWMAAAPSTEFSEAGPQVQYGVEGAVLVVPAGGPSQAIIYDASGKTIGAFDLVEGQNPLPGTETGIYVIRFPFQLTGLKYTIR
ncbi:ThuA domain-containing protein [Neolewinella persica]|uniref:ThuA domain-containing protein n=1 Tax=Neolewinella persica TaxID=70998 RepID=UPI00037E95A4|nr:ThuA domain-containing protein [Neolewinella persica]